MAAPSIHNNELNRYFSLLTPVEKESVLTIIRSMVAAHPPSSAFLAQYNQEIDEAIARVESGQYTTQEDLEKEMEQW